jgi:hypothetical protein
MAASQYAPLPTHGTVRAKGHWIGSDGVICWNLTGWQGEVDDLGKLTHLSAETLLGELKTRYTKDNIYVRNTLPESLCAALSTHMCADLCE